MDENRILLPDSFNVEHMGCCMSAARIITGKLLAQGKEPVVVEGWIQFLLKDGRKSKDMRFSHTWVENDGEMIDPTIKQFFSYMKDYEFIRTTKEIVPDKEYMDDPR